MIQNDKRQILLGEGVQVNYSIEQSPDILIPNCSRERSNGHHPTNTAATLYNKGVPYQWRYEYMGRHVCGEQRKTNQFMG